MSFPLIDEPHLDDDPRRDPQETAFLQSIVENPDDDASRLIFADWLEENARTDKAVFVRLEVEFSHEPQSSERYAEVRDELFRLDAVIGGRWSWALVRPGRLLNCGEAKSKDPVLRFVYQCPNRWTDLTPLPLPTSKERYCGECRKNVHFCENKEEAETHAVKGDCIAIGSRLALAIRKRYPPPEHQHQGWRSGGSPHALEDDVVETMGEVGIEDDDDDGGTVGIMSLPLLPPSPYQLWAEELFARHRKRWWQIWK